MFTVSLSHIHNAYFLIYLVTPEASSTMPTLAGARCSGTYLYLKCVKPDISTTSTCELSLCWTSLKCYFLLLPFMKTIYGGSFQTVQARLSLSQPAYIVGPPSACQRNAISLKGRWWPAFQCLLGYAACLYNNESEGPIIIICFDCSYDVNISEKVTHLKGDYWIQQ